MERGQFVTWHCRDQMVFDVIVDEVGGDQQAREWAGERGGGVATRIAVHVVGHTTMLAHYAQAQQQWEYE